MSLSIRAEFNPSLSMPSSIDLVIVVVYLVATVAVGVACRGRQRDEDDYFTAGGGFSRLLGTILVGLSIAASFFSGISMLAYPSVAYRTGPGIAIAAVMVPVAGIPVLLWFLPRFLQSNHREPYGLLEERFGYSTRALASTMYILLRLGWMGTLIYAPTAAIMAAFQLSDAWFWPMILTIGLSSTVYTVWGGLRGVIVTDAIQFLVLLFGILWPIAHVLQQSPLSISEFWEQMEASGTWTMFNTSFDMTEKRTLWSLIAGFLASNLAIYIADQMSLQRYLASGTIESARKAFLVNVAGVVIVTLLLTLLGMSMAAWYSQSGHVAADRVDDIFPRFVATVLPTGAPGLIFAAILAATMSSMTSGINSLAAAISLDIAHHFRSRTAAEGLKMARRLSLVLGLLATATAGVVRHLGGIFDIAQSVIGAFSGPLLVCMACSVATFPVASRSLQVGMVIGTVVGWTVVFSPLDSLWVAPLSSLSALFVTAMGSVLQRMFVRDRE